MKFSIEKYAMNSEKREATGVELHTQESIRMLKEKENKNI